MKALLSDAIDDFMVLRASQDFSKRTLANERTVLKRLLAVNGNVWCHSITDRHVTRYFEEAGKTRSPNSQQLDHTVLGQLFEWMRHTRRMPLDVDPMVGRRRPKPRKRERDRIPVTEFPRLLEVAERRDPRDRMIVAVLLYTLVRERECSDIRLRDVDLAGGWLRIRITKTGQEDSMPICSELDSELRRWLSFYASEIGRSLEPSDFLVPRRYSTSILRGGGGENRGHITGHEMLYAPERPIARLGNAVRLVLEDFGFSMVDHMGTRKMEGAHTLRRSGARALFDRLAKDGYDHSLRVVQSMLHHASITQTEVYVGVTADRRSRDEILRGKPMYALDESNVLRLSV
jgi:integrase